MNWQEFEDNLKGYVGAHETPVDTDALWANIRRKKRRRMLLFWWFFGGVCLLGGIGWLSHTLSNKSMKNRADAPAIEVADATRTPELAKTGEKSPASAAGKSETNVAPSPGVPSSTAKPGFRQSPGASAKLPSAERPVKTTSAMAADVQPVSGNGIPVTKEVASSPESMFGETLDKKQLDEIEYTFANRFSTYPFEITPPFVRSTAEQVLDLPVFSYSPAPFVSVIKPAKSAFRIGIQAGIAYWGKIQEPAVDPVLPRTGERLLEAFNLGVFYQKPIDRRWAFRAGIQYVRYNSVFNWQTSWVTAGAEQQVLNYYVDGRIDTTYLAGALIESSRTVRQHNQNNSLTIPMDLQFRIPVRRGVLTPFVGIQPGFLQTAKGVILDGQGRPDYALYSKVYNRRFGFGLRAGLSLELPLRKYFALMIEPAAGVELMPRNASGSERFRQFGINVGIVRAW